MLHRLCGPPSIPLSFSLATVLPRRIAYRVSCGTAGLGTCYTKQSSFRARTTRVSNPVCSPSFRASASVMVSAPPSPQVFLPISTHFTATPGIPRTSPILQHHSFACRPELSPGISQVTCGTAYAPFTPNNSEQRSHPLYYRGCWHRVSRCFFHQYRHYRLGRKGVYAPRGFILHAALLRQGFPHCAKFPTAASRRSLDRVSVPVCPCALSGRIPIFALVGHYPAN